MTRNTGYTPTRTDVLTAMEAIETGTLHPMKPMLSSDVARVLTVPEGTVLSGEKFRALMQEMADDGTLVAMTGRQWAEDSGDFDGRVATYTHYLTPEQTQRRRAAHAAQAEEARVRLLPERAKAILAAENPERFEHLVQLMTEDPHWRHESEVSG